MADATTVQLDALSLQTIHFQAEFAFATATAGLEVRHRHRCFRLTSQLLMLQLVESLAGMVSCFGVRQRNGF